MDISTATHRIAELERKIEILSEVVKLQQKRLERNDELNTYMWYRGYNNTYWRSEGSIHVPAKLRSSPDGRGTDTYYIKFDDND